MKTKLFALIFMIFSSLAFAEEFYRVTDVRGKATYDNSGNWELIYSGQKVSSGTMIRVGINSSVTITANNENKTGKFSIVCTFEDNSQVEKIISVTSLWM